MKKVQKYSPAWILPLTFVLTLSILWLLFPKSSVPQPVYQNKPLSDWLNPQPVPASPRNYSPFDRYVLTPDGVDAVNALGEDCIPWLLHAITPKPNPWKEGVLKLTKGTGFSWPSNQTGLKAILAFEVLGSRGAEAIPYITSHIA